MKRSHNDVDFSQRTAAPSSDGERQEGYDDQAERIARAIQRDSPHWSLWHDPVKREEFIEGLREALGGAPAKPKVQEEPEEQPFDQDKFFGNIEEMWKQIPKKL